MAQFVEREFGLGDFAVVEIAEPEHRLLAIAHADIEALRLQAQASEGADKATFGLAQRLAIDLAEEGQHLGEMVVVIGRRQDDLRAGHGDVLYSFAKFGKTGQPAPRPTT